MAQGFFPNIATAYCSASLFSLTAILTVAHLSTSCHALSASLESPAHGGFSENPMADELDRLHPQPAIIAVMQSQAPANYSIFSEAIRGINLENRAGKLTLFAPTNEAFKAIPKKTLDCLQTHAGKILLRSLISYHSVFGNFRASALTDKVDLQSYAGFLLPVNVNSTGTFVGVEQPQSQVTQPDLVVGEGGAVHGINAILAQPLLYLEHEARSRCGNKFSSVFSDELL